MMDRLRSVSEIEEHIGVIFQQRSEFHSGSPEFEILDEALWTLELELEQAHEILGSQDLVDNTAA